MNLGFFLIDSNSMYKIYKESVAHTACLTNMIRQSSLDIVVIMIPLISDEGRKL
jgi:hypothetical protein